MLIPLGFLAGSGGGVDTDFELIETQLVPSTSSAITFTNLGTYSGVYRHLQIRSLSKTNHSNPWEIAQVRLNGDSGSNYATHSLAANGSSVTSNATANASSMAYFTAGNTTANAHGALVLDILDAYSTSKNKTLRMLSGSSSVEVRLSSGVWLNTNSITSITLSPIFGSHFTQHSRFSIYGVK